METYRYRGPYAIVCDDSLPAVRKISAESVIFIEGVFCRNNLSSAPVLKARKPAIRKGMERSVQGGTWQQEDAVEGEVSLVD